MKTSHIEVRDMLSVLNVDEVEKRIRDVPGVESATVNHAAGNATVRYDETLLEVADIKVMVHQRGQQPAGESEPKPASEHKAAHKHALEATPEATPASASTPVAAVPRATPGGPATTPATPAGDAQKGRPAPGAPAPAAAVSDA